MQKVLLTGASKGIGQEIAKILFQASYKVFITARDEKALQNTPSAGYLAGDLLKENFINELIKTAEKTLDGIDILINNAGFYIWSPIERTEQTDIEKTFILNLQIPYQLCQAVVPNMKQQKKGRIINIGSISGIVGEANASLYSASKAGLLGLTKALALELAENNITVNLISPGWVKTALTADAFAEENNFSETEQIEIIPQRRFIEPSEIAQLVKYLISDSAKGITGQNINLCAGLSLG